MPKKPAKERVQPQSKQDRNPSPQGRSGFVFTDRSGKVHSFGKKHAEPVTVPNPGAQTAGQKMGQKMGQRTGQRTETSAQSPKFERSDQRTRARHPEKSGKAERSPKPSRFDDRKRSGQPKGARQERQVLRGTVDKNRKGFGFISFLDRKKEDLFVPPQWAERIFHGDRVEATVNGRGEIQNLKVLEHRFREIVGRFHAHPKDPNSGWVVYERKRAREEVYVQKGTLGARSGQWVRCSLEFHEDGPFPVTGTILDVYGDTIPATADVGMIAAEFGLIEEHTPEAETEARSFKLEIPGKDLDGREDLRHVPFITIDGETARDFDDAVYVERRKSGYRLWVAIADVSHYVTPGTALDREALSRGTSVYFPERAFHMLPHALSTHLCSLRPKEPRLAMAGWIDYDRHGKTVDADLMEAVIESKRRATYTEIAAEFEIHGKDHHWEFKPHFELYDLIRKSRTHRGSIDFELPEADVVVDAQGEPIKIENRPRNDAHRLIEEFMIAANEGVTRWMMDREWPFVYRIHEEPALASLQKFEKLAATVGIKVALSKGEVSPKLLADVVKKVEGHPAQDLLNMALLRSLKQAIYSATHGIHYGLASEAYTHFTSPIRRYPDLVVHRLIRWALQVQKGQKKTLKKHERDELEEELAGVAEHCSYRERVAANADREAIRLKQVRFMTKHLGEDFDAKVIGMSEAGLFVMIPEPYVEGMVPREAMLDDFYEYNEDRMIFFGRRSRKTYKVGDRFRVRVVRADLDRRQIDFSLSEHAEAALVERNPWSRGPRPVANPIPRPAQSDEQTDLPQWENAKSPRKFSKESQGGRHDGQKSPRRRRR